MWNRTAATVAEGDIVVFNLSMTGTETTNNLYGDTASGWASVLQPTTATGWHGIHALVRTGGADDVRVKVMVRGRGLIRLDGTAITTSGERVGVQNASFIGSNPATGAKALGITMAVPTSAADTTVQCVFDGVYGFGTDAA